MARKRFIDSVNEYNVLVRQFPVNLTAMVSDRIFVMHKGRLAASGTPHEVLRDDLMEKVFDCRLVVGALPAGNVPYILPQSASL